MWTERFQAKGLVPLWTPLRLKMRQNKTPDCVAVGITATQSGVSRSVSRVLCRGARAPRDGHSSGTPVAGRLVQPTRAAARRPAWARGPRRPYSVLLPVGFAVPLPLPGARCALTAPFHPCRRMRRRSAFCGTFPEVAPAGRYPAPYLHGARTFLSGEPERPSDRLAPSHVGRGAHGSSRGVQRRSSSTVAVAAASLDWRGPLAFTAAARRPRGRRPAPPSWA